MLSVLSAFQCFSRDLRGFLGMLVYGFQSAFFAHDMPESAFETSEV
jgi:hypothetical protein